MRVLPDSLKAGLIGFAVLLVYLFLPQPISLLEVSNLKFQDLFFNLRRSVSHENSLGDKILLITVDDESVKKMQSGWPFKRKAYAEVLKKMEGTNPALIAFDFVFSGKSDPISDFILAESFRKAGNVILASFVDQSGTLIPSQKEIMDAAKASGIVNKVLDRDLYVRRAQWFFRDQEGNVASRIWEAEIAARILSGDLKVRADQNKIRINYRLKLEDIRQIPFWKAYEEGVPREAAQGKVVIFATTSHLLHDYYHTPFGLMPGVMINLNLLANLLNGDFIKDIPAVLDISFFSLVLFLSAFISLRWGVLKGLGLFGILVAGVITVCFILFMNNHASNGFTYLFGAGAVFLAVTFYRYFRALVENMGLRKKAITDALTGLYNRRALEQHLDAALEQIARAKGVRKTDPFYEVSVLMIDVDDFKKINDAYGHPFGDDVLRNVSFVIKENTRANDFAARYGGEEFCVVLQHTAKDEAREIAEKIRQAVESKSASYVKQMTHLSISIGVASAKADNLTNSKAIIRAADQALYEAKRTGKNKVCFYG